MLWPSSSPAQTEPGLEARAREEFDDAWRDGVLTWKLDAHQREIYDLFHEWNARRQTSEYTRMVEASGATLDDVWVEEIARRVGKTHKWIVLLMELAIQHVGALFTYATAAQKSIGQIIVPMSNRIASDAPQGVRWQYHRSSGALHEGLFCENGSIIKLVGIDEHPDALRGQYSDGVVISEAAFVKDLEDTCRSIIIPQFQRRPWAFLALESSTAKQPDHDFSRVFRPDAELRRAYVKRTIDVNLAITEADKAKWLRQAGGRGHPTCEREYYCVETRDPEQIVVPEFDEKFHVRHEERPPYALCCTAADPGSRDMFGLVFGYYDFVGARGHIERSWARRNPSTRQVACVVAFYEWKLWGKWPSSKMGRIPLRASDGIDGWLELLRDDAELDDCIELHGMANAPKDERPEESWPHVSPTGHFTFWDGDAFQQNPHQRRTDVDVRFVQDLIVEYGLPFNPTPKDDAEAQRNNVRDAIAALRLTFEPEAGPVIAHFKNAIWNKHRTDFERSTVFGHYDCLAASIYWWRNLNRTQNPTPAAHIGKDKSTHFINPNIPANLSDEARAFEQASRAKQRGGSQGWRNNSKTGWRA